MNSIHRMHYVAGAVSFVMSLGLAPSRATADFEFADLASIDGLNLVGDAAQVGAALRIVPAAVTQGGAAWFASRQQVSGGFDTTFEFQLSNPTAMDGSGQLGGDGFAFVVQTVSADALSDFVGFGLGYHGIASSIAVEFDTWLNGGLGDPTSNHVGVMSRSGAANQSDHATAGLAVAQVPGDFNDGVVRTVRILYEPNVLSVFIDDLDNAILTVAVDLDELLALDNGGAFVGFTAATGGAWADHDVLSWSFTASGPGCEVPEDDPDGDGVPDCFDGCPDDPEKIDAGVCGCGTSDDDTDGDGTLDCKDECPDDTAKTEPGSCGCGVPDDDTDGDGVVDCADNCANTPNSDQADSDGNGVGDACESGPAGQPTGTCGCGAGSALLVPLMLTIMGKMRRRQSPGRR